MAVVRLTSMEALILSVTVYIDPSPQPTAGKQPCARIPTGHCLRTNDTSEWMPTVSDSPSARSPTATNKPQAELHSVHSFLYFPIGTIVIGLLCTSYKNRKRYKQGAESLLVADWSKIGHLNNEVAIRPAAGRIPKVVRLFAPRQSTNQILSYKAGNDDVFSPLAFHAETD